jgi:hypothetical protein
MKVGIIDRKFDKNRMGLFFNNLFLKIVHPPF